MKSVQINSIVIKNKDVIQKELDGITYLMNPNEMTIHTLNHTASFIWNSFNKKISMQKLVKALTKTYAIDEHVAVRDLLEFVRLYVDHGMLRII